MSTRDSCASNVLLIFFIHSHHILQQHIPLVCLRLNITSECKMNINVIYRQ